MNFSATIKQVNYLQISKVFIGSLLLAFSAQLSVPLMPVPITLQTVTVLFIGMIFGWRLGLSIVILYLFEGACGVPVFANMSFGLHVLFGPTGGYLFGFIPAVIISGFLSQRGWSNNVITAFLSACLACVPIFIVGILVLASFVGVHDAYLFGVKPFLLIELIKLIVLAFVAPSCWKSRVF